MCYNTKAGGIVMQTLYIDVYFLINFSVDFLSLYFAASLARIPTSTLRLVIGGLVGALIAILNVFVDNVLLGYLMLFVGFILMTVLSVFKVSLYRRVKFAFCFSVTEMLVGGLVYFLYGILERAVDADVSFVGGAENRGLLILAVIILISIGLFKLLVSLFTYRAGASILRVEIEFLGRRVVGDALVDTGNLARDPADLRSVMLIDESVAKELLCGVDLDCRDPSSLPPAVARRIRMIPISRGERRELLLGITPDSVYVISENARHRVDVILAIDKKEGGYGGADMLMPSAAVSDVFK